MGAGLWHLEQKRDRLKREVAEHLDFLEGSVTTQGPNGGHILTTKVKAKTRSRYIRVGMLEDVRLMTNRNKKLKQLLKELGELNWEILKLNHPV